jgi:hypothetical protein
LGNLASRQSAIIDADIIELSVQVAEKATLVSSTDGDRICDDTGVHGLGRAIVSARGFRYAVDVVNDGARFPAPFRVDAGDMVPSRSREASLGNPVVGTSVDQIEEVELLASLPFADESA